jgi:hypothetical protein
LSLTPDRNLAAEQILKIVVVINDAGDAMMASAAIGSWAVPLFYTSGPNVSLSFDDQDELEYKADSTALP